MQSKIKNHQAKMTKRLLLWDIDSTLINSAGAGLTSLKRIIARRYGTEDDLHDIEIAGRTDAAIARSILQKYGVEADASKIRSFLDEYLELLPKFLTELEGRVLPGIK